MIDETVHARAGVLVDCWNQAIDTAGDLLLQSGACIPSYLTAMKNAIYEFGAYMVVAPGVAIPHARPEAGALRSAVAVVTLARPVPFGNRVNDPVDVVIAFTGLAPAGMPGVVASLLFDQDLLAGVRAAATSPELLAVLHTAAERLPVLG